MQLHVSTSVTGHQKDFPHQVRKSLNGSSVYEYYVVKSGYDENRLTKHNHSTAFQTQTDNVNY